MSVVRDPDRTLSLWLEEGPTTLPDSTARAISVATRAIPQRRLAMRRPWRTLEMPTTRSLAVAAAALAVVVLGGLALLGGIGRPQSGVGATSIPTATPSAVASPSSQGAASPSSSASAGPCVRAILPGLELVTDACRHVSEVFKPTLSVAGGGGWLPVSDLARGLEIQAAAASAVEVHDYPNDGNGWSQVEGVEFATIDRLAAHPCAVWTSDTTPIVTVPFKAKATGTGPADFFAWLSGTGVRVATPSALTVGGTYQGLATTIADDSREYGHCGDAVQISWLSDTPGDLGRFGVARGLEWRLIALDVKGTVVVVEAWAPSPLFSTFMTRVDKLVSTLTFE